METANNIIHSLRGTNRTWNRRKCHYIFECLWLRGPLRSDAVAVCVCVFCIVLTWLLICLLLRHYLLHIVWATTTTTNHHHHVCCVYFDLFPWPIDGSMMIIIIHQNRIMMIWLPFHCDYCWCCLPLITIHFQLLLLRTVCSTYAYDVVVTYAYGISFVFKSKHSRIVFGASRVQIVLLSLPMFFFLRFRKIEQSNSHAFTQNTEMSCCSALLCFCVHVKLPANDRVHYATPLDSNNIFCDSHDSLAPSTRIRICLMRSYTILHKSGEQLMMGRSLKTLRFICIPQPNPFFSEMNNWFRCLVNRVGQGFELMMMM